MLRFSSLILVKVIGYVRFGELGVDNVKVIVAAESGVIYDDRRTRSRRRSRTRRMVVRGSCGEAVTASGTTAGSIGEVGITSAGGIVASAIVSSGCKGISAAAASSAGTPTAASHWWRRGGHLTRPEGERRWDLM